MASELTQVLPLALSQLVNQNQLLGINYNSALQYASARDVAYLTQVAAAQTVTKVREDKERAAQVPKRSEPNFSPQDEKPENEPSSLLKNTRRPKHEGDLDIVA